MSKINIHQLATEIMKILQTHEFVCSECERKKFNENDLILLKQRVIDACSVTVEDFEGSNKHANVFARRMFILIAKEKVGASATLEQLGAYINRDHCTVLHSYTEAQYMRNNNNLFKSIHTKLIQTYYA
ncbi:MAG TPA: helix-turn-helix domain-containing protein [Bacteroidia bacterium]|nr:helix-turn-helix domain-containing protein [Bacteroidia bacterium]